MRIKRIESADLNGEKFVVPDDFKADRTLLLIAFEREQQEQIDGWTNHLQLESSANDWFELPVIDDPGFLGRKFIDMGMQSGIQDIGIRSHVVTLYTDRSDFLATLGFQEHQTIYVAVADRAGEVLEIVEGEMSEEKAQKILAVWKSE